MIGVRARGSSYVLAVVQPRRPSCELWVDTCTCSQRVCIMHQLSAITASRPSRDDTVLYYIPNGYPEGTAFRTVPNAHQSGVPGSLGRRRRRRRRRLPWRRGKRARSAGGETDGRADLLAARALPLAVLVDGAPVEQFGRQGRACLGKSSREDLWRETRLGWPCEPAATAMSPAVRLPCASAGQSCADALAPVDSFRGSCRRAV